MIFDFQSVLWEEDGKHYFVHHPEETYDLQRLNKVPIPRHHLFPAWHPGLPLIPEPIPEDSFIKRPSIVYYRGDNRISTYLLAEADILTLLEQHQHPNVGRFLGCTLDDDVLISGLCLKRYRRSLAEALLYDGHVHTDDSHGNFPFEHSEQLDHARILQGIVAGVKFIHSLGLVHNDLNPRNIMLDDSNAPIIVDFDSCKPAGTSMKGQKSFTAPWGRRNTSNTALYENDFLSLGLLELYLNGAYPPSSGQFSRVSDPGIVDHAIAAGKGLIDTETSSRTLN
jgi:serine/threonine protein kinase